MRKVSAVFGAACALAILCSVVVGCGGSSGGAPAGPTLALVKLTVGWGARSRAITGPASALSAIVKLAGANPNGGDFTFTLNRNAAPAAYSQLYTSPLQAKTGATQVTVTFYGAAGGSGPIVATASESATIAADGTGIVDVTVVGTVAKAIVASNELVTVGSQTQLAFTAEDASNNVLAVSPGSATWAVSTGAANLTLTADGIATGVAAGTTTVTATVDGIRSSAGTVVVAPKASTTYTVAAIAGSGLPAGATVFPSWITNSGDIVGYLSTNGGSVQSAFLWKNGAFTVLSGLGSGNSVATCVNDADHVVGTVGTTTAFVWVNGSVTFSDPSFANVQPPLVNQSGQFVRSGQRTDGHYHCYLQSAGVDTEVLPPSGTGGLVFTDIFAKGMSDSGEISGTIISSTGISFFITLNGLAVLLPVNLQGGSLQANFSYIGPNNNGQGVLNNGPASDYLLDSSGNALAMGTSLLWSFANNFDQVVGPPANSSQAHASIWQSGTAVDLNTLIPASSGWVLTSAVHINDKGQIVGSGTLNGVPTGYILTPQ